MSAHASRRRFLKSATLGAAWWVAPRVFGQTPRDANSRLRYACVGVNNRGRANSDMAARHGDIAALCDVDSAFLDQASRRPGFRESRKFADWREMFDQMSGKIDAVTIAVPDHQHACIAATALKHKLAVYCEKPLTHTVWEARRLAELAREAGVATSMGNHGTANNMLRHAAALLRRGILGTVREVHVFTNRPIWPQGNARAPDAAAPSKLNWDLWLGPAAARPYAAGYHPFSWRGWWDFGTGALGDMACHTFNMPFAGLNLANPVSIQAWSTGHNHDSYPQKERIQFEFPHPSGTGTLPVWWYDGGNLPEVGLLRGRPFELTDGTPRGTIIVGDDLVMYSPADYCEKFSLIDRDGKDVPIPEAEYEKGGGEAAHFAEFHQAATGERKAAMANFADYAGPLTETILLGNLAVYAAAQADQPGKKIEWDAKTLTAVNAPEVQKIVKKDYRGTYGEVLGA